MKVMMNSRDGRGTFGMLGLPVTLALLVVSMLFVSTAEAQQIDSVSASEGSIGTQVVIVGDAFGPKKPKVNLVARAGGRVTKLKVISHSNVQITAEIKKATAGNYNLQVVPNGLPPIEKMEPFRVMGPQITFVGPGTVETRGEVTISGSYFGDKKGKIRVGGRKTKVKDWNDESIVFIAPKNMNGEQSVTVENRVGSDTVEDAIFIIAPPNRRDCERVGKGRWTFQLRSAGKIVLEAQGGKLKQKKCSLAYDKDDVLEGSLNGLTWNGSSFLGFTFSGTFEDPDYNTFTGTWSGNGLSGNITGFRE